MTKHFSKWVNKHKLDTQELNKELDEVAKGNFEANLGGGVIKKRIPFTGHGKSKSGRTIICFKNEERAIFLHGFAKNEKANISSKELVAFKAASKVLLSLSESNINQAIKREKQLKNWKKEWKLNLMKQINPNLETITI